MRKLFPHDWIVGALALSALAGCGPEPGVTTPGMPAAQPGVSADAPPSAETMATKVPPGAVTVPAPPAAEPGYSGVWAVSSADCIETTKTYVLGADALKLSPQSRNCDVKSLREEHPTGRSAIYRISAVCASDPPKGASPSPADEITLNFGASDTVMQLHVNAEAPLTLERCPTAPTP